MERHHRALLCALDVHKRQVTACVHVPPTTARAAAASYVAEFQTTVTSELLALRNWLKGLGVTHVAMEATGVYWKPVYYLLEDDFELWLCQRSARGSRRRRAARAVALPGWLEHGLVRGEFRAGRSRSASCAT